MAKLYGTKCSFSFYVLPKLAPCLAEGDGPGFGHLLDFFSPFSPSPWFGYHFPLPDFSSDRTTNPSTAGDGTDRGYPCPWSHGLRLVVKILVCPRAGEEEQGLGKLVLGKKNRDWGLGKKNRDRDSLSLGLIKLGKKERGI
ncbi:hypothetical protein Acr_00g0056080 [Actinidia rufa]|uniref:Uncharacterized protein n=1 Tax=Actinidia rufa TaxID=165716 RepID=A0A7J0DMN7_9ERIC|nr:hypothetical protein Acr_00g0056080 [Actinidia rufa]